MITWVEEGKTVQGKMSELYNKTYIYVHNKDGSKTLCVINDLRLPPLCPNGNTYPNDEDWNRVVTVPVIIENWF